MSRDEIHTDYELYRIAEALTRIADMLEKYVSSDPDACPSCNGTGIQLIPGSPPCPECKGTGKG